MTGQDTVMYQIYPRSFADSDGDGIGDLRGITGKLGYLHSLGIGAIWLSPFYPSPQADFGYDIADYCAVDPVYGTLDDFDLLVREAHALGIRVIVDLVMNHTSDEHPWFEDSRSSRSSAMRDWYIWADPAPGGGVPNNWLSAFEACGPAWTFDERTGQYYLHSFTARQPDLNWRNPRVRERMEEVWRFWLGRGADGFRVDVAHRLMKDAGLRDNPQSVAHARRHFSHPTDLQCNIDLPEVHEVWRALRRTLDSYGDCIALGEVPISDPVRLARYLGSGDDELHTVFDVDFWGLPWDATAFREWVGRLEDALPPGGFATRATATHDISRAVSRFGGRGRARLAAMMILTLPGMPCVYYGDEIGMSDVPCQRYDVDGRDQVRTPMQWDPSGQGFGGGTPWLPFGDDLETVNVERQLAAPDSMLSLYKRLIACRRGSADLRRGGYSPLDAPPGVFAYERGRLTVLLNFAEEPRSYGPLTSGARCEISTHPGREGEVPQVVALAALEGMIVRSVP